MSGSMYYNSGTNDIITPYSNGWYYKVDIFDSTNTNILTGPVQTNSAFKETWSTKCTPPTSGIWTVSSTCTLVSSTNQLSGVIILSNVVVTVPPSLVLNVNTASNYLYIVNTGGVLVELSGQIK